MKYSISVIAVIVVVGMICLNAQSPDPLNGIWKLNATKSQVSPADLAQKSATTKFEVSQDTIKMVNDAIDVKGRALHAEYTAKFDGKDYSWNGTIDGKPNPDQDAVAAQRVDSHTYLITNKLKGQTLTILRIVVAADGKSRTNTLIGKTVQGQPVNVTMVYEKQ